MPDLRERLASMLSDRYAIEGEIGRGGMATVFAARDLRHSRDVAIKVLHPELAAVVGPERFRREIEIIARLDHPHILPLYESGEVGGLLYYVMPRVAGESLRDLLDREGPLATERALRIAREVADGLQFAHAAGIVHRDIKPSNIMLSSGHARVADFGVAGSVDRDGEDRLTATGLAVGSPAYMSPEQAGGEPVDRRTDIFSLGCVLFEMLAGEPPFTGDNPRMVHARRLSERPASLTLLRNTVPGALDSVVRKSLAVEPADRFQTAGELQDAVAVPSLLELEVPARREREEDSNLATLKPLVTVGGFKKMLTTPLGTYLPADPVRRVIAVVALAAITLGMASSAVEAAVSGRLIDAAQIAGGGLVLVALVILWIGIVRHFEGR